MRFTACLLTLVVLLIAAGCGDGDAKSGGGASASGPVGSWELDVDRFRASIQSVMEKQLAGMDPEMRKVAEPRMQEMVEGLAKGSMETTINADGTFSMASVSPEGEQESGEGTWKLVGDVYEFTMGKKDGKAVEPGSRDAKPLRAKLEDGLLVSVPDEGKDEPPIYMKRK